MSEVNKEEIKGEYTGKSKLHFYHFLIELSAIALPIILAVSLYLYPSLFLWIENKSAITISLISVGIIHLVLTIIEFFYRRNIFFLLRRYIYVVFFIFLIYMTGGIDSSLIFVLFFPLLASATYLDKMATRDVGVVVTIAFVFLIFLSPIDSFTPSFITKHIIQVILFGVIAYLMHRLIVEILVQKQEKGQVSKRLAEVIELDGLKNDFLSTAQHQLRTPLTGVKWVLETLQSDSTLPKDTLNVITSGLDRVKDSISIINKMLLTVEGKEGYVTLSRKDVDIVELIETILNELNFVTQKKEVRLSFNSTKSIIMSIDKDKMKAALNNIIDNAIKYSPRGNVDISLSQDGDLVRLVVKDTGIGIIEEDLPYVFDHLHRGKNAMLLEPDESGVGLYISKKIVELHGGKISVNSEIKKGTTVSVILPIKQG